MIKNKNNIQKYSKFLLYLFLAITIIFAMLMLTTASTLQNASKSNTVSADEEVTHTVADADGNGYYNDITDNRLRFKVENGEASVYAMNTSIVSTEQSPLIIPHKITNGVNTYDVTSVGSDAFYLCSNVQSITLPNTIRGIIDEAVFSYTDLTSITIPEGVTAIADFAFNGCENLATVIIPSSVISIGDGAFDSCISLETITLPYNGVVSVNEYSFHDTSLTTVYVPSNFVEAYEADPVWGEYTILAIEPTPQPQTGVVTDILIPSMIAGIIVVIGVIAVVTNVKPKRIKIKD